ncbi:hypothetical protein GGU10DRAFT_10911 [Lentinula aff. detonsa]|uniref:Uncharacterized protein n=1 Tax=Lentinula aff. detonsa TaxID=2804958 RepID=A0AA38TZ92_9AGAR|nr:hypothetical protein GGU10DRAFT_10911 [Lentinula aff. detonsa]
MTENMKPQLRMNLKTPMNPGSSHDYTTDKPSSFVTSILSSRIYPKSAFASHSFFATHKHKCSFDVRLGATKNGTERINTPTQVPVTFNCASALPSWAHSREGSLQPFFPSSSAGMSPKPSLPLAVSSSQQSPPPKLLKSLVISSDLNALLNNSEEDHERYTNPPPSPPFNETNGLPKSLQVTTETGLLSPRSLGSLSSTRFSPSSPSYPSSPHIGTSGSPSSCSSASSNSYASPFASPIRRRIDICGHTPDTSVASLESIVEGEPMLKSLPPPPRPRTRRATTGEDDSSKVSKAGLMPFHGSRLGDMTVQAGLKPRPVVKPVVNSSGAMRVSRVVAGQEASATETKILEKFGGSTGPTSSKSLTFLESVTGPSASSIISVSQVPKSSGSPCDNSRSLLPITSSPTLIQHRTSRASNPAVSNSRSSSDTASTITPERLEMEVHSAHQGVRLPSLPAVVPSSKRLRHSIRHFGAARNLSHRSAPLPNIYASAGDILDRKISRRAKVLSAEDVLGELFRKEDALHSLRILAKTGTGVTYQEEAPPQLVSPSLSRYSRTSGQSRSTSGLEELVGSSFLRMVEDEEEEEDLDVDTTLTYRHDTYSSDVRPAGPLPTAPTPTPYAAPSSEVSVMYLDEEQVHDSRKVHPFSGYYPSAELIAPTRSSAFSAKKSVSSRSSKSTTALSYARTGGKAHSKSPEMGSTSASASTECHGGNATAASVAVQGVNNDEVSRRNRYRRQRPARIYILPTEDKNGTRLQHPTSSNSDALPQLPKLNPPSPLSASFERSLGLSPSSASSATGLAVPEITATNQALSFSEDFSLRQQRSSLVSIRTESEESSFSRRPSSISTLAFGNLKSPIENEVHEISSGKDSSSSA